MAGQETEISQRNAGVGFAQTAALQQAFQAFLLP
jgi:hypothetical protein